MIVINLRIYYPVLYGQDVFCEVPEQVKLLLDELKRLEHAQNERRRYHGEYLEYHESATDGIVEYLSSEEEYLQSCRRQELYRAMLRLPAKQMRRIYAHFFLQLSLTEIARVEKVSIAAVSSSITQGILHLRRYLSKD
ncbi:MAG TPA: sigma factor-like helix-turn-helix DNA-binding protein [Clostridia bacterium]|nr:sigma factor-like helix-turn-helix DNA-binding protein [Clostridia bacterium]HPK16990.1 sigma factor-like helix-turn-helix DNA-binding protein [Clostridia bacterium]